jgi:regulator of sigma E protease
LIYGLAPSTQAQEIGFVEGDKVLRVDGASLEDAMDINKSLLLRSPKMVEVQRANGAVATLSIPEDFGKTLFASGEMIPLPPYMPAIIGQVVEQSPAAVAGIMPNDRILGVDDVAISSWVEVHKALQNRNANAVTLNIERDKVQEVITVAVVAQDSLGISFRDTQVKPQQVSYAPLESMKQGFNYGYWTLFDYIAGFKFVFTKKGASQLGGFGTIGSLFPAEWNWRVFWERTALISIILAFMNVLPIPALDGGHVVFLTYEMLTGRKPHQKVLEYAQMAGLILLLGLFVFANGNDIYRFILS